MEEPRVLKFPCRAFRENRIVLSREELIARLNEANAVGKSCEVGFYAFSTWINMDPMLDSIVIDKVIFKGAQQVLEKIAERKLKQGIESTLIFDGKHHLLFVKEPQEKLQDLIQIKESGLEVITDVESKFTFPGYPNLKTGQLSKIVKKWRVE